MHDFDRLGCFYSASHCFWADALHISGMWLPMSDCSFTLHIFHYPLKYSTRSKYIKDSKEHCDYRTKYNMQFLGDNPPYQATKQHSKREKWWKMRWRAKPPICFLVELCCFCVQCFEDWRHSSFRMFYAFGSCFRTLAVSLVSNFWYSTKLHGSCYMKLLPSWHMFCVHHTTMHQFKVLFKPKAKHTFTWSFVMIWMDGAETTPLKLVQEFIKEKEKKKKTVS